MNAEVLAGIAVLGAVCTVTGTIVTLINARRSARNTAAEELTPRIVEQPVFRDKVKLIVTDQLQLQLNREDFARDSDITLLSGRLDRVEKRLDTLPGEVGQQVAASMRSVEAALNSIMIEIRQRGGR